jgi:Protein RETICULATA-related
VGATLNFILVYLLSPVALVPGIAPRTGLSKVISELPANIFATGSFSAPQRLAGFLYKGTLFAICGFLGSVVGTSMSQGLIDLRRTMTKGNGDERPRKALPNLAITSAAWAGFMFFSSNPRYQAVAGLERALFSNVPEAVAKVGCASARTINNVVGGAIWVWWARALGIQVSKPPESQ